jgi:murein DD-endopeptidase MepM/ murein hydrolase activator NlpD
VTPLRRTLRSPAGTLALLLLCAAPGAAADLDEARRRIEAIEAEWHLPEGWLEAPELAKEAAAVPTAQLDAWVLREAARREDRFATPGALPERMPGYGLPFDALFPRVLSQGFDGEMMDGTREGSTHIGGQRYAVDFIMPLGAEVRAARAGTVALVIDGFGVGGKDASFVRAANVVTVLHEDGTFAKYVHLEEGIPVEIGQTVEAGETLGRVGMSGFSVEPHLHFFVATRNLEGFTESKRFRFGGKQSVEPEPGQIRYGVNAKSNAPLRIRVGGALLEGSRANLPKGEATEIAVSVNAGAGWRELEADDPNLQIDTLTPSTLAVEGMTVRASPSTGFDHWEAGGIGGELRVLYQRGRIRALRDVRFSFGGYVPPKEIRQ